jgi:hypothetical protein
MRMAAVSQLPTTTAEDFRRVLNQPAVQPVFQPLVDPDTRRAWTLSTRLRIWRLGAVAPLGSGFRS